MLFTFNDGTMYLQGRGEAWGTWYYYRELDTMPTSLTFYQQSYIHHHPWFDTFEQFFNWLAPILGLLVFLAVTAYLVIFQSLNRCLVRAIVALLCLFPVSYDFNPCLKTGVIPLGAPNNAFSNSRREFHTSSMLLSLSSHTPEGSTHSLIQPQASNSIEINIGDKIQEGFRAYWTYIPNITSSDFFDKLEELIRSLTSDSDKLFAIILQPEFNSGQRRTLGTSFHTSCKPQMNELIEWLQPLIDNFEAQSGGLSMGPLSLRTYVSITDITGIPEIGGTTSVIFHNVCRLSIISYKIDIIEWFLLRRLRSFFLLS